MGVKSSREKWGYIFVIPGVLWYGLFMLYPMYYAIILSAHRWMGVEANPLFVGLDNFKEIFTDSLFYKSTVNTFYFTFISVSLTTFTALFIAILLTKVIKLRAIYRTFYFLPSVAGVVAVGIIWTWCYQPTFGLFNRILQILHLPPSRWIMDPKIALFCVAITQAWMRLGFNIIVFLAGLLTIPEQFYDAAKVDGAGGFHQLVHITLPLARPIITFLLIYNTIYGLTVFGEVYMLTEGGPGNATYTVAYLMYETAFRYSRMGKGSAMALFLFLIILAITVIQMKFFERRTQIEY